MKFRAVSYCQADKRYWLNGEYFVFLQRFTDWKRMTLYRKLT